MKLEQIIKLIDAGYSKEDIEAMNEPAEEPAQEPAKDPEPAPAAEPKQEDNAVLKELQDLKKAVFAMNIMQSEQPASKSVDDILSEALKGGR